MASSDDLTEISNTKRSTGRGVCATGGEPPRAFHVPAAVPTARERTAVVQEAELLHVPAQTARKARRRRAALFWTQACGYHPHKGRIIATPIEGETFSSTLA